MIDIVHRAGRRLVASALASPRGWAWVRRQFPDLVVIFLWHGIAGASPRPGDAFFDQEDVAAGRSSLCPLPSFLAQLDFIQAHFEVVSLHEAAARLGDGRSFGHLAVLTFDDALASAWELAVPELLARGLPVCVFVNAALAGGERLRDGDILTYATNRLGAAAVGRACRAAGLDAADDATVRTHPRRLVSDARWPAARQALLDEVGRTEGALARETRAYATWDQLAQRGPLVSIGNHGARHLPLASLGDAQIEEEILGGASEIRTRLGIDDQPYAYAYGGPADLPARARAIAGRAHRIVLSAWGGFNPKGQALDALLRVPVRSTPDPRRLIEHAFPARHLARAWHAGRARVTRAVEAP